MLDEKFLEKWVKIIVPEEYGPNKDPDAGKKILGIYIISADKMKNVKNTWYRGTPEDAKLFGQIVDIGEVLALTGDKDTKLKGRYVIRLNESQSEAAGIFALAHEVGHLHGMVTDDEKHKQDQEEFADRYAFKRIGDTIDSVDLRLKVYIEAFSHERV